MTQEKYDLAIVGAGIAGLAHAWSAAERGLKVAVFERDAQAQSASIRNFGMVWPIGQRPGFCLERALVSRERWLHLKDAGACWVNPCGSLHLAHSPDEWAVLEEFSETSRDRGYECELLSAGDTLKRSQAVNPKGLQGSLWSTTELCVDPRRALCQVPSWLASNFSVSFHFNTPIRSVHSGQLVATNNQSWRADKILICSGADFKSLYPTLFAESPMTLCKLQMMATAPNQPGSLGPHLASGLTLRHYSSFEHCPSLETVKARFQLENPLFDKYGVHVMASQSSDGSIILGDSHEYDDEINPFRKAIIDEVILKEARRIFHWDDWTITRWWDGIYAKTPGESHFTAVADDNVRVFTGLGGSGMTLSFGLAEYYWEQWCSGQSNFHEEQSRQNKTRQSENLEMMRVK